MLLLLSACGGGEEQPAATTPAAAATDRIVFDSDRQGNFDIYVMNAAGADVTRLTDQPALDGRPAWSPDGSRIAFNSDIDGTLRSTS